MRSSPERGKNFVFVLAEAELETIPKEILSERAVVANAKARDKKASNLLLDASYHHSAMRPLKDGDRRGRPDIAHFFLLLCLDSRLNKSGRLKIIIHTRNDEKISVASDTRLPPSYHRFMGLMESLFQNSTVPSKQKPLIELEKGWTLRDILTAEKCNKVILLDADGPDMNLQSVLSDDDSKIIAVVIGGFPSGKFRSDLSSIDITKLSLGKDMLKAWTVTSEMLVAAQASIKGP